MKKRILCFTLILTLLLGTISFTTFAEAPNEGDVTQNQSSTETEETQEKVDLKKQIVPENEVPDLIDYNVAIEKKYVCRAYWEETSLNEVVFLRADGALDRYIFSFPVKYTQGEETYDKIPELEIQETLIGGKYRFSSTEQNDITLLCADVASDGVLLQNDQMQISLRPITVSEYDFLRGYIEAGSVVAPIGGALPTIETFDSVVSEGSAQSALTVDQKSVTAAVYSLQTNEEAVSYAAKSDTLSVVPSYTGFKMDLNLAPSGTQTQFCFLLDTNDLILVRELDTLLLLDPKGNPVGIVGDLLSENGAVADAQYTVTDLENGEYLLSAIVNRPAEASTVTMSVTAYYDYIQDASIYSNDQNTYGSSRNLWIGRHGSVGIEHVLIRPNNWYFTSSAYPNHVVQSANVVIRDITATTPEEVINCHPFTGSVWNESTATWNSIGGGNYGAVLDQNSVSADIGYTYGYYYYFDIAPLVRNWYSGAANWQKGVVFRWNNDGSGTVMEKCFASTQYPTEAYRPRFEVTTQLTPPISNGIYFLNNAISGSYLDVENQLMQNGTIIHQWQFCGAHTSQWYFEWQGDGYYTIRSCKNLNYYLGVQSDSSADQAPVVLRSGTVTDGMKWKIVQYSSGKYKIIPKIGESLNRILAVQYSGTNQAADGLPIKSFTFSDDGYNSDLWILEAFGQTPCKLLSYEESNGAIRYEYFSAVSNKVRSYLGFNILQQNYTSLTKPQIKRYLFDTKIFIVHTHGVQNGFLIAPQTLLTMTDIGTMHLGGLNFALLLTCNTAVDYSESHIASNEPVNIVEKMVCNGAETVIGFKEITYVSDCNKFAEDFIVETVQNGYSVSEAMGRISYNNYVKNMNNISEIGGNKNLHLTLEDLT